MKHIAIVCKLMPLYRLAVFHELSKPREKYGFTCFGDIKKEGGIEVIPWEMANNVSSGGINWIRTTNYFYISERLLWQTGIIKNILFSKYDYFIFEGGVFHLPTWLFALLCRVSRKKAIFWTHGFLGFDKGLKKIIRTWYFKLAHGLLLYGNYSKELMVENGFNEEKLFVIFNSLDTSKQFNLLNASNPCRANEKKATFFNSPNALTLIFIGRLVKTKNLQFLTGAVKELLDQHFPVNCIIIGDGPEMKTIKNYIAAYKLENNIHLTGAVYEEEEICEYFQMSDILVSPGNVGLNCMHALAYGVPVITHNNLKYHGPEVEAIIPGQTGLLFEYNNYQDLIVKIKEWKNIKFTKCEIKLNCQKIIKDRYNPANHAENIIKALDQI